VCCQREEILKYLLHPLQKITQPPDLLHVAAEKGSLSILNLVLKRTSNLDALHPVTKETPLLLAIRGNRPQNVSRLYEKGASLKATDAQGKTVLHLAAGAKKLFYK